MIAFLVGGGGPLGPAGADLLAAEDAMTDWYASVAEWTGFTMDELLNGPAEGGESGGQGSALLAVRHVALAIGVHDVLADRGIHPASLTGFSLGGMTAACLAGALSREDLIRLVTHWDETFRPEDEPPQAVAFVRVPPGADEDRYFGRGRPGVYFSCDYGPAAGHTGHRVVVLSGLRAEIHALVAELPAGSAEIMPFDIAYHSPLRQAAAEKMRPHIGATEFRDPVLPLASCLERGLLTTADDVRDFFHRNPVSPLSVVDAFAELQRLRTGLCVGLGPALPPDLIAVPFPMLNLIEPGDLALVAGHIMELGLELPDPVTVQR